MTTALLSEKMNSKKINHGLEAETILIDEAYFSSLIADINEATISIKMETYIFANDDIGKKVLSALCFAAERGVDTRLMIDGIGSRSWTAEMTKQLVQAGGMLRIYHPLPWLIRHIKVNPQRRMSLWQKIIYLMTHINTRNHRKVCVIDNRIGYIGSANITRSPLYNKSLLWHDVTVKCVGNLQPLIYAFNIAWGKQTFKTKLNTIFSLVKSNPVFRLNYSWRLRRFLYKDILYKIKHANKRIWITNAYFVPRHFFLKQLAKARRAGIDVRIVITKDSDVAAVSLLTKTFYNFLLKSNIILLEYSNAGILHAKILIIDDWMCVGSSNINYRSFRHDLEADISLQYAETKKTLENQVKKYQHDSTRITSIELPYFKKIIARCMLLIKYWC
ncbi:MAG: phosphatidylserine/phosphatidylglycerophosphate/cardiolipin synthase family protein [Gammaproteobacteria bacterium]|nr:phosphatidylserine/phosphatidylglycerophosphate/cardiolipin synthase family protein [Gammaproteobacteria bacterium]